ncbi:hypothetical protein [Roseibium sp. SCP14]|uniref:hypothetical protein n=1 Tax=Roseibium sp. SCP14 TaxID=3141375 RepID=UPI0033361640
MFGSDKAFDVEHALIMYAEDYVYLPAAGIYDDKALAGLIDRIRKCHIYMVGFSPRVDFEGASQDGRELVCHLKMLGDTHDVRFPLPEGADLHIENVDGRDYWRLEDQAGRRFFPSEDQIQTRLSLTGKVYFEVQYIGQAYGKSGSRNALDRLRKHETVQKIAVQGVPEGHSLQVVMLKVVPTTRMLTMFNPRAKDISQGDGRIKLGLDKLFNTDEAERTTLYEASLIRHFEPKYNKSFKDSFPSTNLKVLQDCYEKDFSAVIAEVCFDNMPIVFKSEKSPSQKSVMAVHNLHAAEDRAVFFGFD